MADDNAGCEVPAFHNTPEEIARVLAGAETIAVVGASPKPERPSYDIAHYLMDQGYKVIPVNPGHPEIWGKKAYRSLRDVPDPVDVVDIFRPPEAVPEIVEEAIAKGVKTVWMQSGIVNNAAAKRAREAGLTVVMNRCMKVEHAVWKRRAK